MDSLEINENYSIYVNWYYQWVLVPINKSIWVFPLWKNIGESVDFSLKKLDNQLLLGEIKNRIKGKIKDFKDFLIC